MCVRPNLSYHVVSLQEGTNLVADIRPIDNGDIRINGGFFIFKKEIFEYIQGKEELVEEPFRRLAQDRQLMGYAYDGFWASMDTLKDKQQLETLYAERHRALGAVEVGFGGKAASPARSRRPVTRTAPCCRWPFPGTPTLP